MARYCHFRFAERVAARTDLPDMLDALLAAEGPSLLEVITDIGEAVYPVVRRGSSYADMELGPYIRQTPMPGGTTAESGKH